MRDLDLFEIVLLTVWILIGIGLLITLPYVIFIEKDVLEVILWFSCVVIYVSDGKRMWGK